MGLQLLAFDKVAKTLGLSYPGGSEIERNALNGDENTFTLPQPLIKEDNLNFSFSGLKTSINLIAKKNSIDNIFVKNIAASFQKCIGGIIVKKLERAIKSLKTNRNNNLSISIVGGVANNNYLKKCIEKLGTKHRISILFPPQYMMSDNAAMVAWATILKYSKINDIHFKPNPRLTISKT